MKENKSNRGGARPGSGPKQKYGEPTTVIRVPVSLIPAIQKLLDKKAAKKD